MPTLSFSREIPLRDEIEIFVAGGGPAGAAAAVTAARQGRRVFLAEGQSAFGGMGTLGLVPAFMRFTDGVHFLAGGFGQELYDRLKEKRAIADDRPESSVSIQAEALKLTYDEMIQDSGAGFAFHTQLIGVEVQHGRIQHAVCAAKSGIFAVKAQVFVDATGDGDLCAWAGAPFEKGDPQGRLMPGTLCSLWAGVDWDTAISQRPLQEALLEQAYRDGVFDTLDRHLPGMWKVGEHTAGGNVGHTFGVDSTDERSLTAALLRGRKLLSQYERYYKEYLKGFEGMTLAATGSLLGVRESRRILGDYVLNLDDFQRRAVFEDEIGRYNYPVDLHAATPGAQDFAVFQREMATYRYGKGESYGVPYRSLLPRGLENALVAGRCLSTDRPVQGSLRVMPGCYITGQAAGMAAALAVEGNTGVRQVSVPALQKRLKAIGGYLPNSA
jgi:hypothetical protein